MLWCMVYTHFHMSSSSNSSTFSCICRKTNLQWHVLTTFSSWLEATCHLSHTNHSFQAKEGLGWEVRPVGTSWTDKETLKWSACFLGGRDRRPLLAKREVYRRTNTRDEKWIWAHSSIFLRTFWPFLHGKNSCQTRVARQIYCHNCHHVGHVPLCLMASVWP